MNIKNEMKDLVDQQNILYVTRNLKQIFSFEEETEDTNLYLFMINGVVVMVNPKDKQILPLQNGTHVSMEPFKRKIHLFSSFDLQKPFRSIEGSLESIECQNERLSLFLSHMSYPWVFNMNGELIFQASYNEEDTQYIISKYYMKPDIMVRKRLISKIEMKSTLF